MSEHNSATIIVDGKEVVVDAPIAELLQLLNDKGFDTRYSCCGDDYKGHIVHFYIQFDPIICPDEVMKLFKDVPCLIFEERYLKPLKKDDWVNHMGLTYRFCIRADFWSPEMREDAVQQMIDILKEVKENCD